MEIPVDAFAGRRSRVVLPTTHVSFTKVLSIKEMASMNAFDLSNQRIAITGAAGGISCQLVSYS